MDLLRPNSRKIIELKQEDQIKNFKDSGSQKFVKDDVVMAKDFRKDQPKVTEARIVKELSPRSCIVEFKEGGRQKRHYDQMYKWYNPSDSENDTKGKVEKCCEKLNAESDGNEANATRKSYRCKKPIERYSSTCK